MQTVCRTAYTDPRIGQIFKGALFSRVHVLTATYIRLAKDTVSRKEKEIPMKRRTVGPDCNPTKKHV
jgi:hypothetical protein